MKKIAKIIWILFMLSVFITSLASCKNSDKTGDVNEIDDDVIYSPYVNTAIVLGSGIEENDVRAVKTAYYRQTGKEIAVNKVGDEPVGHEIIIGETEREISQKAYRVLSLLEGEADDVGYVIYSDGKSVAIAFDKASLGVNIAFTEAIDRFVYEYMQDKSLKLESGPVFYELFDPFSAQSKRDKVILDRLWNLKLSQITEKLNGDEDKASSIISELKKFCDIYNLDYETVKWLVNLYDPETGGFYYSNSARNNIGYLPDIDSTYKALIISKSIAEGYGGTLKEFLGEKISNGIIAFVKNMQNSEDGYFYHTQWSQNLINKNQERKDNDVIAATNILALLGAQPTYDTPNGVKGEGRNTPASKLTNTLSESSMLSVSRVVASAESEIYIPPHLRSKESFTAYLEELKIRSDTVAVCEALYAEIPLYRERDKVLEQEDADYRLVDLVMNYIKQTQNSDTGLWSGDSVSYEEIEELISIVKLYNVFGEAVPHHYQIIKTIASFMRFNTEIDDIGVISKVWLSLATVIENIITYGYEYEVNMSLENLYSDIDGLIRITKEQLLNFKKTYGSFSVTFSGDDSEYLGMPVAAPRIKEGNINGTFIALNDIYLSVFKVLNVGYIPMFDAADRMMFRKTLVDMGIIVKDEIVDDYEYEDFDTYELGVMSYLYLEYGRGGDETSFAIKEDTVGDNKSQVLEWTVGAGKSANYLVFERTHTRVGAFAAFFETDMMIKATSEKETKLEMRFRSSSDSHAKAYTFAIAVKGEGSALRIIGNNGTDFTNSLKVTDGEWFKLRLEYTDASYDYTYDGINDLIFRVYINDVMVGEGHTPVNKDKVLIGENIDDMMLRVESARGCIVSLDNVILGQCTMDYSEPAPPDTDTITYEPGIITEKTQLNISEGSAALILKSTVRGDVSKVLELYSKSGNQDKLTVTPTLTVDGANAISFETDIMIAPQSDVSVLYLEPTNKLGKQPFRLKITAAKDGNVTISSAEIPETVIGKSGEWIHLKIEYMNPLIDYTGDRKADILYKVYVGETPVLLATGYQPYTAGAYYSPLVLTKFVLTVSEESEATVQLDNTRFWQLKLDPDEVPTFPEEDEDFKYGESAPDYDGWT